MTSISLSIVCSVALVGLSATSAAMSDTTTMTQQTRGTRATAPARTEYLQAAIEAANWFHDNATRTPHGMTWPVEPAAEQPRVDYHLYSGMPGGILFLLELHKVTGEQRHLDLARSAADEMVHWIEQAGANNSTGLWVGLGGQMFTLHQVYLATKDDRYRDAAVKCVDALRTRIDQAAANGGDIGGVWNNTTDIVRGAAGSGMCLLYAEKHGLTKGALEQAKRIGDWLITHGKQMPIEWAAGKTGLDWPMTPEFPRVMPNFSHGTAGVCYYLTELHLALGSDSAGERYLEAAKRGTDYLLSIADQTGGGFRIYHHTPAGEDLFYFGWCHGPVGTSRLFKVLDETDSAGGWLSWIDRGLASIVASGVPERRPPGLWNTVGLCCGTSGVGAFVLSLDGSANDADRMAYAKRLADDLLKRSETVKRDDGSVVRFWVQAEHRVRPEFLQAQTGYMHGSAGVGLFLLQLDAAMSGRPFTLRLPDDPF